MDDQYPDNNAHNQYIEDNVLREYESGVQVRDELCHQLSAQ